MTEPQQPNLDWRATLVSGLVLFVLFRVLLLRLLKPEFELGHVLFLDFVVVLFAVIGHGAVRVAGSYNLLVGFLAAVIPLAGMGAVAEFLFSREMSNLAGFMGCAGLCLGAISLSRKSWFIGGLGVLLLALVTYKLEAFTYRELTAALVGPVVLTGIGLFARGLWRPKSKPQTF